MTEGDQPRVKRSRFDTGPDANGAPPPAAAGPPTKAGPPSSEAAKAALEKARAALATRQRLAETLAKLKKLPLPPAAAGAAAAAQPNAAALPRPAAAALPGARPKQAHMPAPLRLDDQGREVDEFGRPIVRDASRIAAPSLKLNQRVEAKKKAPPQPKQAEEPAKPSFYDPEMGERAARKLQRQPRASFDFVAQGRFQKQAELQRLRAQFGDEAVKEQHRQDAAAKGKKRGGAPVGDANAIPLGQRPQAAAEAEEEGEPKQAPLDPIPDVEWWDARLLRDPQRYGGGEGGDDVAANLNVAKVTLLVEHPVPIQPPAEEAPPPPMPLMLTAKERKKMRTQRRNEREKEKQELISQGLLEPPRPKVRIANLMRVLGEQAVADPTQIEAEVRAQMAEREQAHGDRNLARKLTPAERREKKQRKLTGDAGEGEAPSVSVYRVAKLGNRQHRFKVKVNAEELHLTGCAIVADAFSLVVAEGGPKSQKRYQKLMLQRIDWAAAEEGAEEPEEDAPPEAAGGSAPGCVLAWTGMVRAKAFDKFQEYDAKSEGAARKFLEGHGVVHYWDLAEAAVQQ